MEDSIQLKNSKSMKEKYKLILKKCFFLLGVVYLNISLSNYIFLLTTTYYFTKIIEKALQDFILDFIIKL